MRTKSFDPDGATKRALEAFWQNGYEATNLPELLTTMNLGRASFYNAFGSKHALFVQTLDLYYETLREHFEPLISREPTARRALGVLVDGILAVARADGRTTIGADASLAIPPLSWDPVIPTSSRG